MRGDKINRINSIGKMSQPLIRFAVSIFTVLFLSGVLQVQESSAGEVWVANMKGANVQIIDTGTNQVVKTIATGAGAHNVTFSPDSKLAFIANLGTHSYHHHRCRIERDVGRREDGHQGPRCGGVSGWQDRRRLQRGRGQHHISSMWHRKKPFTPWPPEKKPSRLYFLPMDSKLYVVNAGDATISQWST